MKTTLKFTLLISILYLTFGCAQEVTVQKFGINDINLTYKGRVDKLDDKVILISSASSITTKIIGNTCLIHLKNDSSEPNYVSIEVDGKIVERFDVAKDSIAAYPVQLNPEKEEHIVTVYKATEASTGNISFSGITSEKIEKAEETNTFKIEFIGDSITCAAGAETEEIPCGNDSQYYDHSDAYYSYASIAGRELNADVVLSSVSGIGIYRDWNSIGERPTMPQAYENLYLNENPKPYNFSSFTPDIISICLGTNDFSNGDGKKERLPFDPENFTNSYIAFVDTIIEKNPNAKIVLLDSPMVRDENNVIFNKCLANVKAYFAETMPEKSITNFKFDDVYPTGCGFHPAKKEHFEMAEQLIPVLKELI